MIELRSELDPTKSFTNAPIERLVQAMGILPNWVAEALEAGCADIEALTASLADSYGFGELHNLKGGEVAKDGTYQYPQDPPLRPLAKIETADLAIYFYPHAMLSIVEKKSGDAFVTRMD